MRTRKLDGDEMAGRTFRFAERVPRPMMQAEGVPGEAVSLLTADKIYTVISHRSEPGPWGRAAIPGPEGFAMLMAECPPGQGPDLHAHHETEEIFTCLRGRFEVAWGDEGEHRLQLEPYDTVSVPPGVCRAFRNVADERGLLQVLITGGENDLNDISFPRQVERKLRAMGPGVVDALRGLGFRFDIEND
jgi:quercetin dioxygenase-like cupin family protein